jgi:FkbM family methyltransferase
MPQAQAPRAVQQLKDRLVALGPRHWLTRLALWGVGFRHGWQINFSQNAIEMRKGNRRLILPDREYINIPMIAAGGMLARICFDTTTPDRRGAFDVWDYSRPGWRKYRQSGLDFYMPAIPEEESQDAYTHWYTPQPGDVVWDVGAHAGQTTYFLSRMVGPEGKVLAWEPDPANVACLKHNIERHGLHNVTVIAQAVADVTGPVAFHMDGTMGSGIVNYLPYQGARHAVTIDAVTLADACRIYGLPDYIKMDIEGAELAVIRAAVPFLREHPIHLAVETAHVVDGRFAYVELEPLLRECGYTVESSLDFECWYTWARPPARVAVTS